MNFCYFKGLLYSINFWWVSHLVQLFYEDKFSNIPQSNLICKPTHIWKINLQLKQMSQECTMGKVHKRGYINLIHFYTVKTGIIKMKRQPINWEIFINHIFYKGLIPQIYKELIQLNNNNGKNSNNQKHKPLN